MIAVEKEAERRSHCVGNVAALAILNDVLNIIKKYSIGKSLPGTC